MRVIIRVMKGLGHVGVGSEAPPNRVCCYLDFYKHTHTHTHTHTGNQVTDFRSFPLGQNN